MALPKAFVTPELARLHEQAMATPVQNLEMLTQSDYALIGAIVQQFNFIEFNLRRCLEAFLVAGLLTEREVRRARSADLIRLVLKAVDAMDVPDEVKANSHAKLTEIEFRRPFRNLLAHWAARRHPHADALVLLSRDSSDAKQIGIELDPGDASTAVLKLADLRGLIAHIERYERWLADQTASWFTKFAPDFA